MLTSCDRQRKCITIREFDVNGLEFICKDNEEEQSMYTSFESLT